MLSLPFGNDQIVRITLLVIGVTNIPEVCLSKGYSRKRNTAASMVPLI